MNKITNFKNPSDSDWASWNLAGKEIKLTSMGRLIAVVSPAGNIIVVKIHRSYGKDNAFVYKPDGELLKTIKNSVDDSICFDDVFFDGFELVLVAGSAGQRVANVINDNGDLVRSYVTM